MKVLRFFFPRELGRLSFFVRLVLTQTADYYSGFRLADADEIGSAFLPWLGIAVLLLVYSVFFVFLPRIRDLGLSGWTVILTLIPFASGLFGIYLLLKQRDPFARSWHVTETDEDQNEEESEDSP